MGENTPPSLRSGHRQAFGLDAGSAAPEPPPPTYSSVKRLFDPETAAILETIPPWIIRRAWFSLAHLLLEPGSTIVDMGCRDGSMAYTMAALAPSMTFIGIDKNPETVGRAKEKFKLDNLEFRVGDALDNAVSAASADAVICNYILHEIFSNGDFNNRLVRGAIRACHTYLKPGGLFFVRDYAEPPKAEDLVYMEMPDTPSRSTRLEELSEPDLLVWYSEYATMQDDAARSGFFLEELPARFPRTRLFRLPHKWAYEFIMRKDARAKWQTEVPKEYTFFNEKEYHKTFNGMGFRVLYSAPHWDEAYIKKHFENRFRLMDEQMNPLGQPMTSFVMLSQKVDTNDSLLLSERRKAKDQSSRFHVTTYRNEVDGRLIDVVSRDINTTEVIPFSIMEGNRLVVYLHEGVPRGLVNSVPRGGRNLDGKFWSGHLTEAISLDTQTILEIEEKGQQGVIDFMHDTMGLQVSLGQSFVEGPSYYPNARFIAEQVSTRFINVEPSLGRFIPRFVRNDIQGFASTGAIRAFDAQSILNAISVGVIPNGNLEMQLLMLFAMLGIQATDWADSPLNLTEDDPSKKLHKVSDILKKTNKKDKRYKEIRGNAGKIKIEKSIFIDEGMDPDGTNKGLAARDVDFAINEEMGMNVATILSLSKNQSGEVMAGVIVDFLPVPERYSGDGTIVSLPMMNLPKEIQNMDMAKKYLAEKLELKPDQISKLGEPYFSDIGITPQRIFPFAVNSPVTKTATPKHGLIAYTPMKDLSKMHWKGMYDRYDCSLLTVMGRVNRRLCSATDLGVSCRWEQPLVPRYAEAPFTTGQVVDVRTVLTTPHTRPNMPGPVPTGRKMNVQPVTTSPLLPYPDASLAPQDMVAIYGGGALARPSQKTKTGESSGKGGKSGGSGARTAKKKPDEKKPADLPRPEPTQ